MDISGIKEWVYEAFVALTSLGPLGTAAAFAIVIYGVASYLIAIYMADFRIVMATILMGASSLLMAEYSEELMLEGLDVLIMITAIPVFALMGLLLFLAIYHLKIGAHRESLAVIISSSIKSK